MEITPEVEFSQKLASNQSKVREKVLKQIGKWFEVKSSSDDAFTEDGMLKLWKGLFFYFWNCDKPLFQEERADLISKYIHAFKKTRYSFLYMDTFFQTMSREWFGIDRYRIEKFMMFVRKFLRECFDLLKRSQWDFKHVKQFRNVLKKTVINPKSESAPLGLKIHVCDIYMEELARAGSEQLTPEMTIWFLIPYCIVFWKCEDSSFLGNVSKDVFLYLINQDADEKEFHDFPVLKFDAVEVQKLLLKYANKPSIKKINMKKIHDVVKEYENFKNDISPMDKLLENRKLSRKLRKRAVEKAALALLTDEEKFANERESFLKVKRKRDDSDEEEEEDEDEEEIQDNNDDEEEIESNNNSDDEDSDDF